MAAPDEPRGSRRASSISFGAPKAMDLAPARTGDAKAVGKKEKKGNKYIDWLGGLGKKKSSGGSNTGSDVEETEGSSFEAQPAAESPQAIKGCMRRPSDEEQEYLEKQKEQAMSPQVIEETVRPC